MQLQCDPWISFVYSEDNIADLPSRGDTCFASVLAPADGRGPFELYNYTSPLDGPDVAWQEGQNGPTVIYRMTVSLPSQ